MAKITDKQYQCLVCKNIESHATNHFGEIYCTCKKCGNGSLECIEPEAIEARKNNPGIVTKLHQYRFNTGDEEQAKSYKELCKQLKGKGLKMFNVIDHHKPEYWEALTEEVKIDTSYVFDNQWNSSAGRVHDWYEAVYPNRKLKRGYWLELTEEHEKAREPKTFSCKTYYKGNLLGQDEVKAINEGEASNVLFNKYWKEGEMDIWSYKTDITLK